MEDQKKLFRDLGRRLDYARKRHPRFAEGQWQALGFLEEEMGEVAKEVTKRQEGWEMRMREELLDLMAVAARTYLGEWK